MIKLLVIAMALSGCAIDKDSLNFLFKKAGEVSVSTQSKPDKPKPDSHDGSIKIISGI